MNNSNSNEKQQDDLTQEEREFGEKLDLQIQQAQEKFNKIGLTKEWIDKIQELSQQQQKKEGQSDEQMKKLQSEADRKFDLPAIDRKGRQVLTPQQIRENYENSFSILKYCQLPICWSNFKDKILFTMPLALMGAYTYEAISLKKINKSLLDMKWRLLMRSFGISFCIGSVFCVIDSIFFDDFCDINSYHYQDFDRRQLMRELRQKFKK